MNKTTSTIRPWHAAFLCAVFALLLSVAPPPAGAHHCKGAHVGDPVCEDPGGGGGGGGGGEPTAADPAIAFVVDQMLGHWGDLMVMDVDGSNQTVVVEGSNIRRPLAPSWSPDGRTLVFDDRDDYSDTCGSGIRIRLGLVSLDVNNQWGSPESLECGAAYEPAWSPNSAGGVNRIAYAAIRENQNVQDLFLIDFTVGPNGLDVSSRQSLTATPDFHESDPTWSPDGAELAVILWPDDLNADADIIVLDPNDPANYRSLLPIGSPLRGAVIRKISWAKSNDLMLVQASNDLWCIDTVDGSQATNLTQTPAELENSADWSSDDSEIVFSLGGKVMVVSTDFSGGGCQIVPDTMREIAKFGKRKVVFDLTWRRTPN